MTREARPGNAAIDRAVQLVYDLAAGRKKWRMTVPANPETDSDLILIDGLTQAEEALALGSPASPEAPTPASPTCGYECPFTESAHPDMALHDFVSGVRGEGPPADDNGEGERRAFNQQDWGQS